ncbi:uncharacterized protein VP01_8399g1, partial [Puccinia sorghi]
SNPPLTSKVLSDYLDRMGIFHEKSAPHEHHQNGALKRTHRMLAEISRSLIHLRALPRTFLLYTFLK